MTNPDYTHLAVVLDRSGSMSSCKTDMEGGLNELFKEQAKLPGTCKVDLVQFDDRYDVVYKDRNVSEATAVLEPRGLTALLDAIGKTVVDLGAKFAAMSEDERPATVIVAVVTDGYENASREWTNEKVSELIKEQEDKWNWKFTFLGANMDAVSVGRTMGFSPGSSLTYDTANVGTATQTMSSYVTATRSGLNYEYTDEDRNANA